MTVSGCVFLAAVSCTAIWVMLLHFQGNQADRIRIDTEKILALVSPTAAKIFIRTIYSN